MGMIHYLAYQQTHGLRVTALWSRDEKKRRGDWRGIQGNFGPPGTEMDLGGIRSYGTLDELLADDQVDLVDVTLPPWLHADVSIRALQAGKHVFCEKPIALTMADADRMLEAARQAERHLLIGHVLPFLPEYQWARQVIESGAYGRLLGGDFRRVIAHPEWIPDFWNAQRVGGPLLDLHVHDAHFIRLLFGRPTKISSIGRFRGDLPEHWHTAFAFADPRQTATACGGVINQPGRSFTHGFEIHLEQATLTFDFGVFNGQGVYVCRPTMFDPHGEAIHPDLGDGDPMRAFKTQAAEVVRSIQGAPSPILGGQLAHDALRICYAQRDALRSRQTIDVAW